MKALIKFERLLLSSMQTFPRSHKVFREAMITWLGDKLWIKTLIQKRLGIGPAKILFSEHHLSHAASSFFCSGFDETAIMTDDGGSGNGRRRVLELGKEQKSSCQSVSCKK